MNTEQERIEKMQAEGKITPAEAERLKTALEKVVAQEVRTDGSAKPASEPDYAKKEYHKLAIAAIVLAAVSAPLQEFGLITGLAGLVFGVVAWHQTTKHRERYKGKWLAVLSVCLAGLYPLAFGIISLTSVLVAPRHQGEVVIQTSDGNTRRVVPPDNLPRPPKNSAAIQRAGAQATLDLDKVGEAEVAKYLKWKEQNPDKAWAPAVLTELPRLESEVIQTENVLIYFGNAKSFVCVARIKEEPRGVHLGQPQPIKDAAHASVSCSYGVFDRAGQSIPGWWFRSALFVVPGHPDDSGQVHMVISEKGR